MELTSTLFPLSYEDGVMMIKIIMVKIKLLMFLSMIMTMVVRSQGGFSIKWEY